MSAPRPAPEPEPRPASGPPPRSASDPAPEPDAPVAPPSPGGDTGGGGSVRTSGLPVLAEVVRSGFVEGRHHGNLVLLAADGSVELAVGDVEAPFFPRSSNKPMQAAAVLRAGLDLRGERLAMAAASHSGEPFHRELVETMLAEHGLSTDDLRCPPDLPMDPVERQTYLDGGGAWSRLAMNCSGKHAAMLAACVRNGWPRDSYLAVDHPYQQLTRTVVEEAAGEPVTAVGVDGCGAPLMAVGLAGLARAFRHFVRAGAGSPERRVADAMRAHPEYVAGTRRTDTALMRALPGVLAKSGAEAVQAVAFPDGRALAFKIDDGSQRALGPVLARALALAGVEDPVLTRIGREPILGGGRQVGEVRAAF
jgi:L-asparaginase II